ncbi:universal stress protein [Streptomyces tritici]|uniref:universal stress protein n=1 Tax=Streptomyces tritici TaxID=2054410 RepID=UPI003AF1B739
MSRSVTVGVDGSPESVAAARWAAQEARLRGVPLRLVFVDEWNGTATVPGVDPEVGRRWAEELLGEVAEAVRRGHPALEVETRRLSGRPATALVGEAAEAAGLLVLGSRGLGSVRGFLLGSVGMAAISTTERAVVLVRAPEAPPTDQNVPEPASRSVVVGVDLDQFFAPLLDFAFQEAAYRGDRLLALHAWSTPPVVRDASALVAAEREIAPDVARRLTQGLTPWRERFPSVELVERPCVGGPARLLLQAAAGADLVVVGRRVRKGVLAMHIGSVTHAVVHHCAVPVAVVAHE